VLKTLEEMKTSEYEQYVKFFKEFGPLLKEGIGTDYANRERLADLLLVETTRTKPGEYTTLAKVVEGMPPDQKRFPTSSARPASRSRIPLTWKATRPRGLRSC